MRPSSAVKKKLVDIDGLRTRMQSMVRDGQGEDAIEMALSVMAQLSERALTAELRLALDRRLKSGRRTEKVSPAQLSLMLQMMGEAPDEALEPIEEEQEVDEDDTGVSPEPEPRRRPRRRKLPEHLAREEQRYELDEAQRRCHSCDGELSCIGHDTSETLELVPAKFHVVTHVRAKYACSRCKSGVTMAPAPAKPVNGGLAGVSLLAHIVLSKYEDHLPLQRLRSVYRRGGVDIPISTMCGQVAAAATLLEPLVRRIEVRHQGAHLIQTDASGLKVLDRDDSESVRRGTMWCYLADRKWCLFKYARTGEGKGGPWLQLAGREGYVQADADNTFDRLFNGKVANAVEAGCWANARRRFFKLKDSDSAAAWPLKLIAKLYRIEKDATARKLDHDARRALRQRKATGVLERLKRWLVTTAQREPPESAMHKACAYCINHWDALARYVEDGRLGPDNNLCELQIRSLAVGRKNYLFTGSDRGAERAASLYSLLRTCDLHDVDTYVYLVGVMQKIAGDWPNSRIDELLPDAWAAARQAQQSEPAKAAQR